MSDLIPTIQREMKNLKWDLRFLAEAKFVASFSKDPSTQTGALIVRPNRSVISQGFNGFPQNMPDIPEYYANRDEKYSRIVHCEVNALILAYGSVVGCTLYTWPFASCDRCAVIMLQAGIKRFVFPTLPPDKVDRWKESLERSEKYFRECGVEYQEIQVEG